jgi:hypothetical protein
VDPARVRSAGGVAVCDKHDTACQDLAQQWPQCRQKVSVAKYQRGFGFAPHREVLFVLPPRARSELEGGD